MDLFCIPKHYAADLEKVYIPHGLILDRWVALFVMTQNKLVKAVNYKVNKRWLLCLNSGLDHNLLPRTRTQSIFKKFVVSNTVTTSPLLEPSI